MEALSTDKIPARMIKPL